MKISFFLLFLFVFCLSAENTNSQNVNVTLKSSNMELEQVLSQIERQTDFLFVYNNHVNVTRKVSVNLKNVPLYKVLDNLFEGTDVKYSFDGTYILLFTKNAVTKAPANSAVNQQRRTVTGKIVDSKGEPVIGANVVVKGTTNGTISAQDGTFSLELSNNDVTLVISYIGYETQTIPLKGRTTLNIQLKDDAKALTEVVVTALGIKREEKALGYAVQKVNPDELISAKGLDITSSLTGKIAGLNIQNSTEFNEDAKVYLRGESPIIIVDGVPYTNVGLNEISPDDIESVSVLKGATASALYGSRGATGAIMVTTKKGAESGSGLNVSVNSNTMFFAGYLAFPKTQSHYAAGMNGVMSNDSNWGPRMDIGQTTSMYNPYTYQWEEQEITSKGKDNYKNFLQFSYVTNNNVSVTQKGKYGSFRTSLSEVYNRGQYPNENLNKITFSMGGEMSWKKFKLEGSASYNKRISSNNHGSGYSSSYIYDLVIWGNRAYDIRDFKNYWVKGKENEQQNWYDDSWYDNPWFKAHEVVDSYDTDVYNTSANASYQITPWLKASLRAGLDLWSQRDEWRNAISTNYSWNKKGYYGVMRTNDLSVNSDAMLIADKSFGKFSVNGLLGGNIYYYHEDAMSGTTSGGLSVPGYYSLKASVDAANVNSTLYQKRVNSLYGKLSLSWASTYFLDVTGRNDWSSTLRSNDRSYFYPSVSGSIVLSQLIKLPSWWDFLKVRSSWTETKTDASIYANNNVYSVSTNAWGGKAMASYPTTVIGNSVKPQKSDVSEYGVASTFLKNRINFDFAYYRKSESNFIISGGVSPMTGFSGIQTNSQETRLRSGFEISLGGVPIKNENFSWSILTNWAHDQYTYQKIDPKYSTQKPWVKKGSAYDWITIYDWEYDPKGNIVVSGSGLPIRQSFVSKIGKTTPDLVWGMTNTFKYKWMTFAFEIDGRVGGVSYSRTKQMLMNSGSGKDTDTDYRYQEVVNGKRTYVAPGVKVTSGNVTYDTDGNVVSDTRVFAPNDIVVSYESYTSKYYDSVNRPAHQCMLDETFVKLRNVSFIFDLPSSICNAMKIKKISLGLTGQNLLLWAKDYKYSDPDKGGRDDLNSPSQRYMGFNVQVNF